MNTESEHDKTLDNLKSLLEDISDKKRTLGRRLCGGGNACGGNSVLKNKSLTELIKIKGSLNRCNIWRIRNPNFKWYTFLLKSFLWFH